MTAPDARRRSALSALRDGRVTVLHATCRKTAHDVDEVIARVHSSRTGGPTYAIDLVDATWTCTCGTDTCAHQLAVQLVTGHGER